MGWKQEQAALLAEAERTQTEADERLRDRTQAASRLHGAAYFSSHQEVLERIRQGQDTEQWRLTHARNRGAPPEEDLSEARGGTPRWDRRAPSRTDRHPLPPTPLPPDPRAPSGSGSSYNPGTRPSSHASIHSRNLSTLLELTHTTETGTDHGQSDFPTGHLATPSTLHPEPGDLDPPLSSECSSNAGERHSYNEDRNQGSPEEESYDSSCPRFSFTLVPTEDTEDEQPPQFSFRVYTEAPSVNSDTDTDMSEHSINSTRRTLAFGEGPEDGGKDCEHPANRGISREDLERLASSSQEGTLPGMLGTGLSPSRTTNPTEPDPENPSTSRLRPRSPSVGSTGPQGVPATLPLPGPASVRHRCEGDAGGGRGGEEPNTPDMEEMAEFYRKNGIRREPIPVLSHAPEESPRIHPHSPYWKYEGEEGTRGEGPPEGGKGGRGVQSPALQHGAPASQPQAPVVAVGPRSPIPASKATRAPPPGTQLGLPMRTEVAPSALAGQGVGGLHRAPSTASKGRSTESGGSLPTVSRLGTRGEEFIMTSPYSANPASPLHPPPAASLPSEAIRGQRPGSRSRGSSVTSSHSSIPGFSPPSLQSTRSSPLAEVVTEEVMVELTAQLPNPSTHLLSSTSPDLPYALEDRHLGSPALLPPFVPRHTTPSSARSDSNPARFERNARTPAYRIDQCFGVVCDPRPGNAPLPEQIEEVRAGVVESAKSHLQVSASQQAFLADEAPEAPRPNEGTPDQPRTSPAPKTHSQISQQVSDISVGSASTASNPGVSGESSLLERLNRTQSLLEDLRGTIGPPLHPASPFRLQPSAPYKEPPPPATKERTPPPPATSTGVAPPLPEPPSSRRGEGSGDEDQPDEDSPSAVPPLPIRSGLVASEEFVIPSAARSPSASQPHCPPIPSSEPERNRPAEGAPAPGGVGRGGLSPAGRTGDGSPDQRAPYASGGRGSPVDPFAGPNDHLRRILDRTAEGSQPPGSQTSSQADSPTEGEPPHSASPEPPTTPRPSFQTSDASPAVHSSLSLLESSTSGAPAEASPPSPTPAPMPGPVGSGRSVRDSIAEWDRWIDSNAQEEEEDPDGDDIVYIPARSNSH